MKIPSYDKIRKQAERYAKENFSRNPQIAQKEQELAPYLKKWNKLRREYCTGEPCICKSHPKYKSLVLDIITPLQDEYSALCAKDYQKKKRMQDEKERALIIARLAKEKYLTMLHDGLS